MSFYEKNAEEYIKISSTFDMSEFYSFQSDYINQNSKVLDFAFGSGRDMLHWKDKCNISGMEACEAFVENGLKIGLNVEYGDGFSKLPTSKYDVIYSVSCLMHIKQDSRDTFLNNLLTKVNDNGFLILSYTEEYGRNLEKDFYPLSNVDIKNILSKYSIEDKTIVIKDIRGISWITTAWKKI